MKILSRVTEPTTGKIDLYGRVGSLLEVGTGFHPELTGRENVYLNGAIMGMTGREIATKFDSIVAFAEIAKFIDTPVKRYSSGMYIRLAFAVAAHLRFEILVVDEVLAVGDDAFQKNAWGKCKNCPTGRDVLSFSSVITSVRSDGYAVNASCWKMEVLARLVPLRTFSQSTIATPVTIQSFSPINLWSFLSIQQINNEIEIVTSFKTPSPLRMACFAFVISDELGQPICGSTPKIERLSTFGQGKAKGNIRVRLRYPKLRDGTYSVSVWFGDGGTNIFAAENCLSLEVAGMTDSDYIQPAFAGFAAPTCDWEFMS